MSEGLLVLLIGAMILCINLAWSLLRGGELGRRYPRAELPGPLALGWGTAIIGAAALYVGVWLTPSAGSLWEPAIGSGLATSGVAIFSLGWMSVLVDSRSRLLPTQLTWMMLAEVAAAWLIYNVYSGFTSAAFVAPLLGAGIWLLPILVGEATKNVGRGDLKLAPVLGLAVGTSSVTLAVVGLVFAFVTAAIQSGYVLSRSREPGRKIPMGPHLITGAWVAWTAGAVGPMLFA